MFRSASRLIARSSTVRTALPRPARRFASTQTPVDKPRSWKSAAVRWGLAGAAVYYYNTSDIFAEEPAYVQHHIPSTTIEETESLPTIEALTQERQQRRAAEAAKAEAEAQAQAQVAVTGEAQARSETGGVADLEEEADQQGAFNPETGEINWDCPCLGGMANGPCGEEFKAAFSCFIYSDEDPKGIDCIDKFKGMQDCFRQHPEIYGSELEDDEDNVTADENAQPLARDGLEAPASEEHPSEHARAEKVVDKTSEAHEQRGKTERAQAATEQVKKEHEPVSESEDVVPKAWHDTQSESEEKK